MRRGERRRSGRAATLAAAAAVMIAIAPGCTSDGSGAEGDDGDTIDAGPIPSLTAPASRLTPFCQAMLALDEELPSDPAVETRDQILEAYREAQPLAPDEIAVEFAAVIDALATGTTASLPPIATAVPPSTGAVVDGLDDPDGPGSVPDTTVVTGDTFFEEGYLPDDDPATRVNEYIDFACRGVLNNPGPPPTQPGGPVTTDGPG